MPDPIIPQQNNEPLQEATLQNQDQKLTENNQLLETGISQTAKADEEKIALAEANLEVQDKILKEVEKKQSLKLEGVETVTLKGDKGESPTKEELVNMIKPLIPNPIKGEKGDSIKGDDGKDADEEKIIKEVSKKIPKPKDGQDGLDGRDADENKIIKEVLKKIPTPKDGKNARDIKPDEIIKMIKNKLSYNDLKDAPEFKPKLGWAGTGYMREITDYQEFLGKLASGAIVSATTIKVAIGTVDDSNKDFVFASKPSVIIINGGTYREEKGWSWNAETKTATLDIVVGVKGDIYGL